MNRLLLTLLVNPTLLGFLMSLNVMVNPVRAETPDGPTNAANCVKSPHTQRLTCLRLPAKTAASNSKVAIRWQRQGDEPIAMLDFTEEESDAAVALFGCDCPLCLNWLRQLRGLPPLAS